MMKTGRNRGLEDETDRLARQGIINNPVINSKHKVHLKYNKCP